MADTFSPTHLRLATRESRLALWQANHVAALLRRTFPSCEVTLVPMTTRGDIILDRTLSKVGGKGLFVKELEQALIDGHADIAVHSLKDVPMELPEGFVLSAMLPRETPNDALVCPNYNTLDNLHTLSKGAKIGTSSLRRTAWLKMYYPHLQVEMLRGNLDTRLKKLDSGEYTAIMLASAGLIRMGYAHRITEPIATHRLTPSPGQGTIALETHRDNEVARRASYALSCLKTTLACTTERSFAKVLQGGCEVPLAAYARFLEEDTDGVLSLHFSAWVANPEGTQFIAKQKTLALSAKDCVSNPLDTEGIQASCTVNICEREGMIMASAFLADGAKALIDAARTATH